MFNRNILDQELKDPQYSKYAWDKLSRFFEYANLVASFEHKMTMIQATSIDTEDYQNRVKELDQSRKIKHDASLAAVDVLNKIAEKMNLEPFYEGKKEREVIANEIFSFVKENLDLDKYGDYNFKK